MGLEYKQPPIYYGKKRPPRAPSSTTSASSTTEDAPVHPAWNDTTLDTLLVSSDGIFFHVSRKLLCGASEVLRELLDSVPASPAESPYHALAEPRSKTSTTPAQRIDLTDPSYESSTPLAFFLTVLTDNSLPSIRRQFPRNQVQTFHLALTLAHHWKAPLVKGVMQGWLCELAMAGYGDEQFRPYEVFVLAAKAGMAVPARMVLEELTETPPKTLATPFRPITDQYWRYTFTPENTWDYNKWPRGVWEEIGVRYLFAMKEALKCEGRKKRGEVFMKVLESDDYDPLAPETPKGTPLHLRYKALKPSPVRITPVLSAIKGPKRSSADKYLLEFIQHESSIGSKVSEKSSRSRKSSRSVASSQTQKVELRGTLVLAKK
ncbi:hypothetical protein IAR50_005618 [Cryptococcus sp. DSM 104548]